MVRLFISSLFTIVIALLLGLYLGFPNDPGYLLISFGSYTFETSLFALLIVGVILYLLFKLLGIFLQWLNPKNIFQFGYRLNKKRKARVRSNSIEGLLYFVRGNWQSSYNVLTKSLDDKDASVVNYLAAAYAAQEIGSNDNWMELLEEAEEKYPNAKSTTMYFKAHLLFRKGKLEQSVAVLEQLKESSINDPSLLNLLKEVYIGLQDWQALKKLLPTLRKNKLVDSSEIEQMQKRIFIEELYICFNRRESASKTDILMQLKGLWKKALPKYREDEKVVGHFLDLLVLLDAKAEAVGAIETAISKRWSDALIVRYGELDFGTSSQQLLIAEAWLRTRPADANLMLCLGRISMRNELWAKAKEYYQASINLAPTADAYGELSRLLKNLGEVEASEICLQNYGDLIGSRLTDLPLPSQNKIAN